MRRQCRDCRIGLYGIKATALARRRSGMPDACSGCGLPPGPERASGRRDPRGWPSPVPHSLRRDRAVAGGVDWRSGTSEERGIGCGLVVPGGSRPHGPPAPARNLARTRTCGGTDRSRQNPRGFEPVVARRCGRGWRSVSHPGAVPAACPSLAYRVGNSGESAAQDETAPGQRPCRSVAKRGHDFPS